MTLSQSLTLLPSLRGPYLHVRVTLVTVSYLTVFYLHYRYTTVTVSITTLSHSVHSVYSVILRSLRYTVLTYANRYGNILNTDLTLFPQLRIYKFDPSLVPQVKYLQL